MSQILTCTSSPILGPLLSSSSFSAFSLSSRSLSAFSFSPRRPSNYFSCSLPSLVWLAVFATFGFFLFSTSVFFLDFAPPIATSSMSISSKSGAFSSSPSQLLVTSDYCEISALDAFWLCSIFFRFLFNFFFRFFFCFEVRPSNETSW